MSTNKNKPATENNANALYLVFRIRSEDRGIIHGMYDEAVLMKSDSGEAPEESEARIGSGLYGEIQEILNNKPVKLDLSGEFFEIDEDDTISSTRFLSNSEASFMSPCIIDWSGGEPIHFFSNVDLLVLPAFFNKDVSGVYDNRNGNGDGDSEGAFFLLKRVGSITPYGDSETLAVDIQHENNFDEICTATEEALNTIKTAFFSHIEDLHLFMLDPGWEDRDAYPADPNLPPRITLTHGDNMLNVNAPNFTFYSNFMEDEEMRMAYFKVRNSIAQWFNHPLDKITVSLRMNADIKGFKVADNVWIEALHDDNTYQKHKDNRFWHSHEYLKSLIAKEHNAETVASWLLSEGATGVAYYSLVEHNYGNEVAYSVAVFKGRKRIMMFMISAFDVESGFVFMAELQKHLGFSLVNSGEKENDWGIVEFDNDFTNRITLIIEAPELPVSGFSVVGLYFKVNGKLDAISPNMLDISAVPELLNLGINAPLPFTGVLSSPCCVKADDLRVPLLLAKQSVEEAQEDDLAFSDPALAKKLAFDLASKPQGKGTAVLSVMLLNISQNTLFDYAISRDLPVGEVESKNLLTRLNAIYPGADISHIIMVPLLENI